MITDWIADNDDAINKLFDYCGFNQDEKDCFYEYLTERDGYEEGEDVPRVHRMNDLLKHCGNYMLRAVAVKNLPDCLAWKFEIE